MKKVIAVLVCFFTLATFANVNAASISLTEAIRIERASEPDTFLLTFLYNEYMEESNVPPGSNYWQYYDIGISAEPIQGQQDFAVGETLVSGGFLDGSSMWAWDWDWNGLQFRAANKTSSPTSNYPTDVPLFSFKYTGSASEFILYDMLVSDSVPAGYIAIPIPEPATLALLGLGGLFFARKKK